MLSSYRDVWRDTACHVSRVTHTVSRDWWSTCVNIVQNGCEYFIVNIYCTFCTTIIVQNPMLAICNDLAAGLYQRKVGSTRIIVHVSKLQPLHSPKIFNAPVRSSLLSKDLSTLFFSVWNIFSKSSILYLISVLKLLILDMWIYL